MPTLQVGGQITNKPGLDEGLLDDADFIGGFRSVADVAARDAVQTNRRKTGMLVYVRAANLPESGFNRLNTNGTTWSQSFTFGTLTIGSSLNLSDSTASYAFLAFDSTNEYFAVGDPDESYPTAFYGTVYGYTSSGVPRAAFSVDDPLTGETAPRFLVPGDLEIGVGQRVIPRAGNPEGLYGAFGGSLVLGTDGTPEGGAGSPGLFFKQWTTLAAHTGDPKYGWVRVLTEGGPVGGTDGNVLTRAGGVATWAAPSGGASVAAGTGIAVSLAGSTYTVSFDSASSPTLTGLTLSGATASTYATFNGSKALTSQSGVPVGDLTGVSSWAATVTSLTASSFVAAGGSSNLASAGDIRVPQASARTILAARTQGLTADVTIAAIDASNNVWFGQTAAGGSQAAFTVIGCSSAIQLRAANGVKLTVDTSSNVTFAANITHASNFAINGTTSLDLQRGGTSRIKMDATGIGFFAATPVAKQSITGALSSVTDANAKAVLTSIITALTNLGLVTNSTT